MLHSLLTHNGSNAPFDRRTYCTHKKYPANASIHRAGPRNVYKHCHVPLQPPHHHASSSPCTTAGNSTTSSISTSPPPPPPPPSPPPPPPPPPHPPPPPPP